jgi:sterol 3beta-glucosyltransferase
MFRYIIDQALQKHTNIQFSPWFDGLLASSWKACQGSDLLIESPSALIGLHIAQSLNIPYYRAFTMPWTMTGAYPHAMLAMCDTWGSWLNRMRYVRGLQKLTCGVYNIETDFLAI